MHRSMAQYRIQVVIIEEMNRVRTENWIGKKRCVPIKRLLYDDDDNAIEVQYAGWYRSK